VSRRRALVTFAQGASIGTLVGLACGAASALFLVLLERATSTREAHGALVYALPVAGLAMGLVLDRYGAKVAAGTNLVIDTIHDGGPRIPLRMAPIALLGTVATHLFGGSAGREGTAVQVGASIADEIAHRLRVAPPLRAHLLAAGVAGGFGAVFGTPVAGAVFGLEFVVLGRLQYGALFPALVASFVGDLVTRALGVDHLAYPTVAALPFTLPTAARWCAFAVGIALAARLFVDLTHAVRRGSTRWLPRASLRLAAGGLLVVAMTLALGTSDYLGLGLPGILHAFTSADGGWTAAAWKLLFTVVTVGVGFIGGEVTPLFFVGATLGSALASALGLPIALGAAVGLAAAFGGAANTPLAVSILAVELFGGAVLPHVAFVSVLVYLLTGHRSVYGAQRVVHTKGGVRLPAPRAMHDFGDRRGHARAPDGIHRPPAPGDDDAPSSR